MMMIMIMRMIMIMIIMMILLPARKRTSLPSYYDYDDSARGKKIIVAFCKTVDAHLLKLLLMLECPGFNILSSNKDHVQSFLNCRNVKLSIKVQHFIMMHILDLGLHLICSISNDTKILPGCKYQSDADPAFE